MRKNTPPTPLNQTPRNLHAKPKTRCLSCMHASAAVSSQRDSFSKACNASNFTKILQHEFHADYALRTSSKRHAQLCTLAHRLLFPRRFLSKFRCGAHDARNFTTVALVLECSPIIPQTLAGLFMAIYETRPECRLCPEPNFLCFPCVLFIRCLTNRSVDKQKSTLLPVSMQ